MNAIAAKYVVACSSERSQELARSWKGVQQHLELSLLSLPVQVAGLVVLQAVLQLLLRAAAAGLRSLQLSQQVCTPVQQAPCVTPLCFTIILTREREKIKHSQVVSVAFA